MSKRNFTDISVFWNTTFLVFLFVFALITVAPVVLLVSVSFASKESLSAVGYSFIASEWSLEAYRYLFRIGDQLWRSYLVSFGYAGFGTALSLVVMSLYSYGLYQKDFPFRKFYIWFMFITMIFGGGLIPTYILITQYLHINNTFLLFLLSGMVNGSSIIILRTFMKTAVPDSLVDAARIDGAGYFMTYLLIVMPLMKAGLATVGLFAFVGRWNDWFLGMLYMDKPSLIPLQTLLWRMLQNIQILLNNSLEMQGPDMIELRRNLPGINLTMACTVVAVVPILFAYPFFQRYFVRGMLVGSLKE